MSTKGLLGALRSHLGGARINLKNRVNISNGRAIVHFEEPDLATQLLHSSPFIINNMPVAISIGGVQSNTVSSVRNSNHRENLPTCSNYGDDRRKPLEEAGVVYISRIPLDITSKFVLGALRRHFGGGRVEVTNRIEINNGRTVVRFRDPKMADKLMNTLPLKVFDVLVWVSTTNPRDELANDIRPRQLLGNVSIRQGLMSEVRNRPTALINDYRDTQGQRGSAVSMNRRLAGRVMNRYDRI